VHNSRYFTLTNDKDQLDDGDMQDSGSGGSELDFAITESANGEDQAGTGRKPTRERVAGGWYAIPKRVTNDLDSDDELLVHMKTHGYSEKQIAARFVEDGRVKYNKKTITSRYRRVMSALEAAMDKGLEDQHMEWKALHVGFTSHFTDMVDS
jgi:hypothetical protein